MRFTNSHLVGEKHDADCRSSVPYSPMCSFTKRSRYNFAQQPKSFLSWTSKNWKLMMKQSPTNARFLHYSLKSRDKDLMKQNAAKRREEKLDWNGARLGARILRKTVPNSQNLFRLPRLFKFAGNARPRIKSWPPNTDPYWEHLSWCTAISLKSITFVKHWPDYLSWAVECGYSNG